jgi:hypothetical protein
MLWRRAVIRWARRQDAWRSARTFAGKAMRAAAFGEACATPAFNCLLDIVNVAHASLCPEALCLAWDCLDRLGSSSRGASATAGYSLVCSWAGRFTGTWLVRGQVFDVIGRDAWDVRVLWALRSCSGQLV